MDLDTCARICGMAALAPIAKGKLICPLLAFFDFAAAFPSVAHEWLFAVLAARGCPDGFINVVRAMYSLVTTFFRTDGRLSFLCWVLAGVLQGCPLSGMLFAIIMDPFLEMFDATVEATG